VCNILTTLIYIYNDINANTFLKGKFVCAPSFLVCAHVTTCARAQAHSLEETLNVGSLGFFSNCLHRTRYH